MFNPISPFSEKQLSFLEDNFVVYDPVSRQTFKDFNGLRKCQVVLMGEMHSNNVIMRTQKAFFELFCTSEEMGDKSLCLLLESFTKGVRVNNGFCTKWGVLSEKISCIGADNRSTEPTENVIDFLIWIMRKPTYV